MAGLKATLLFVFVIEAVRSRPVCSSASRFPWWLFSSVIDDGLSANVIDRPTALSCHSPRIRVHSTNYTRVLAAMTRALLLARRMVASLARSLRAFVANRVHTACACVTFSLSWCYWHSPYAGMSRGLGSPPPALNRASSESFCWQPWQPRCGNPHARSQRY